MVSLQTAPIQRESGVRAGSAAKRTRAKEQKSVEKSAEPQSSKTLLRARPGWVFCFAFFPPMTKQRMLWLFTTVDDDEKRVMSAS